MNKLIFTLMFLMPIFADAGQLVWHERTDKYEAACIFSAEAYYDKATPSLNGSQERNAAKTICNMVMDRAVTSGKLAQASRSRDIMNLACADIAQEAYSKAGAPAVEKGTKEICGAVQKKYGFVFASN